MFKRFETLCYTLPGYVFTEEHDIGFEHAVAVIAMRDFDFGKIGIDALRITIRPEPGGQTLELRVMPEQVLLYNYAGR